MGVSYSEQTWFETTARENFEAVFEMEHGVIEARRETDGGLRFLQIGAFRGDASVWLLDNILTDERDMLYDVDPWADYSLAELADWDMEQVFDDYKARMEPYDRHTVYRGTSNNFFKLCGDATFDFIYVDGDHTAVATLEDAVHSYRALKLGGLLCFDDYTWLSADGLFGTPTHAIDAIKLLYTDRLYPILCNQQFWFRKIA